MLYEWDMVIMKRSNNSEHDWSIQKATKYVNMRFYTYYWVKIMVILTNSNTSERDWSMYSIINNV